MEITIKLYRSARWYMDVDLLQWYLLPCHEVVNYNEYKTQVPFEALPLDYQYEDMPYAHVYKELRLFFLCFKLAIPYWAKTEWHKYYQDYITP